VSVWQRNHSENFPIKRVEMRGGRQTFALQVDRDQNGYVWSRQRADIQAWSTAGRLCSPCDNAAMRGVVGYRAPHADYSENGANRLFEWDLVIDGPTVGAGLKF